MAKPRVLERPPINEALVDLRFLSDQRIDIEVLKPLRERLQQRFPKVDERNQFAAEFRVEAGKLLSPNVRDLGRGLWMTSSDGSRIVQFRPDGFTFNNVGLGSYLGGDALLEQSLECWSMFAEITRATTVTRIALRYLNRLDLPLRPGDEFRQFLTAPPELPEGAPQSVSGFLSRVVSHDDAGATVVVTQKLDTVESPVPVIVDVEAFFTGDFGIDAESLRTRLETLRRVKNETFFALITEEAVKLYL
jgi:uncharacterized protein (TIGR04255 family)